jgi:hypothetical protein
LSDTRRTELIGAFKSFFLTGKTESADWILQEKIQAGVVYIFQISNSIGRFCLYTDSPVPFRSKKVPYIHIHIVVYRSRSRFVQHVLPLFLTTVSTCKLLLIIVYRRDIMHYFHTRHGFLFYCQHKHNRLFFYSSTAFMLIDDNRVGYSLGKQTVGRT